MTDTTEVKPGEKFRCEKCESTEHTTNGHIDGGAPPATTNGHIDGGAPPKG
jgi:hypothetical protein